jgi:putative ABC transport system substrate-binding protein
VVSVNDLRRPPLASLVHALRDLGYEEGRNLELLAPVAAQYGGLEAMAASLAKREPEVFVAYGTTATRAAKAATWTIPIVMLVGTDPIKSGFVRSLARPEGNITGIVTNIQMLAVKRVELLKEMLPGVRRVGVLWSAESATQAGTMKDIETAALRLGLSVHSVEVSDPRALKAAFDKLSGAHVEAFIPANSALFIRERAEVARLAASHKLPAVYPDPSIVREGGLISYGPDEAAQFRRVAEFVDRILKGAKPGDLAVEQPSKYEMLINVKAAKALGIEIPKSVLFRANEVIQ